MKVCHFCGKENQDDAILCVSCGLDFKRGSAIIKEILGNTEIIPFIKFSVPEFVPIDKISPSLCYSRIFSNLEKKMYGIWVYFYKTSPKLMIREDNRITEVTVRGSPINIFPRLVNLTDVKGEANIPYFFKRKELGESFLLLFLLKSKDTLETFSVYLIDSSFLREGRKEIIHSLRRAAERFGLPLQGSRVQFRLTFRASIKDQSQKRVLGENYVSPKEDIEVFEEALPLYIKMMKKFGESLNVPSEDIFGVMGEDSPYKGWYYVTPVFYRRFFLRDHAYISFKTLESMAKNYPPEYYTERYIPNIKKNLLCLVIPAVEDLEVKIEDKGGGTGLPPK